MAQISEETERPAPPRGTVAQKLRWLADRLISSRGRIGAVAAGGAALRGFVD